MAFYGPSSPNETHYEALLSARQRFGNLSANMFFVRPARHIACPRRLKYIHDIATGYIPYVEDSNNINQSSYRYVLNQRNDNDMNNANGFGFYNVADSWRQQLMELAQQVKTSLTPADEQEQCIRSSRSARLSKHRHKRSCTTASNCNVEENDEQNISKRLLNRNASPRYQSPRITKSKLNEKTEQEQPGNDENQDSGIWLIPILCYILQMDNVAEAQEWLINANPTEKRLARELISRTMQDMQNQDNDTISDLSTSDQSSTAANFNNVYWPYKVWQRQEKDRQQQQIQQFLKQSKLSSCSSLPSLTVDNNETCERATSPLRIVTPAKRLSTATTTTPTNNNNCTPVETMIIERLPTRNINERVTTAIPVRENQSQMTDRLTTAKIRPLSRNPTPATANVNDRPSRRGYRVATCISICTDNNTNPTSATLRGKTPLV
ncbi:unnamed protein product [Rotaria sp. Silwood2]|nr:unnamed protein product [Rotaria sp. Silwood2]CAF2487499.1 unnamed protein product [Rotaria sp. Silwood2]CAF2870716.1 unnamed protein product [Rotaria sp. Silwood2]CAF4132369.1 unnamed protein product [Rotaria sp. Silwood2]CAF4341636.1 unnamed protein product [Rotaria sp. Silwood2]